MVFIVIRYARDGALELIEDEDEDGESVTATWPNVSSASEWAQGNSLIQSGQVSYKIYDIPSGDLRYPSPPVGTDGENTAHAEHSQFI